MANKLLAIASKTFLETIRQPIFGILMWVAAGLLILNPSIASFSLQRHGDTKMMIDIALSTMLLYGLLASVFCATNVVTREIEGFTVLTVISKPVSRPVFFLGKFFGVATAMMLSYYFLSLIVIMTVRHGTLEYNSDKPDQPVLYFSAAALLISVIAATFGNYVYGWHFSTALTAWVVPLGTVAVLTALFFGREWESQSPFSNLGLDAGIPLVHLIYALLLVFMALLILTAFAVSLSTRFSQVVTLMLCSGIFVLGLLSDYYFGRPDAQDTMLDQVLYHVVPNLQLFWVSDALTQKLFIPGRQIALVAGYTGFYTAAILSLGVAMFQNREVG